jgi:DNA-binding GntR family transcriptional regulator
MWPQMASQPDTARAEVPTPILRRTVLREEVKNVLLERILSGRYAPGERLIETRIAQELGVSQAPVREALRDLEFVRLVESIPFRGAHVRQVGDAELAEVYPIRGALEEVAAREAAKRMRGDVTALEIELAGMAAARDLREQVTHDVRFHQLIVEASANSRLIEIWRSLQVDTRTAITAVRTGLTAPEVAEMHRPIVEALRRRDARAAGRVIRSHVERFGQMVAKVQAPPTDAR